MRRAAAAAAVALAALAAPTAALAHSTLTGAAPRVEQRFERSPRAVTLRFSNTVKVLADSIQVLDAGGRIVSRPARELDALRIAAPLPALAKGPYTVRWRALSASDGHVVNGVYTFGVRYLAPPVTKAVGSQDPTPAERAVRWLYFVALALLVGGLVGRLVVVPDAPPRLDRRLAIVSGIGVVSILETGIAAFVMRSAGVLRVPFGELLYGDISPLANETRYGRAFVFTTLGFVVVATLLFLAWLLERRMLLWPALVVAVAFASGLSLSGHASEGPHASLAQLADWLHLVSAAAWAGGLAVLVACVWPAAPELRRSAFLRFSRLATVLVAVLLAAGTFLAVVRLPALADLWREGYGRVLLLKLGLVAVALAWGGFHRVVVRPVLAAGGRDGFVGRVGRSLLGEGAVALAVLLAAAVLVETKPPAQPPAAPARAAAVDAR